MKLAIINDTHWGVRNDSAVFLDNFTKFYDEVFFPALKARGVTTILHLGDLLDRRKFVNYVSAKTMEDVFFKAMQRDGIDFHLIVGNHDTYYKNSNEINGPMRLYGQSDYTNLNIYWEKPVELTFDGCKIMLAPWLCPDNYVQSLEAIKSTDAQILMGHFEISGFEMERGHYCEHGLEQGLFNKFDIVYSGHFHHPSKRGNIQYLGSPYEMTWNDYGTRKGFHIFDTDTRGLEFIENPFKIFHKLEYSDDDLTIEEIGNMDVSPLTNTYVKVIVKTKNNPYLYDLFLDKIQSAGVADLKAVEDKYNFEDINADEFIDEAQDTLTILKQYVDGLEIKSNKQKVDSFLRELYKEAVNQ